MPSLVQDVNDAVAVTAGATAACALRTNGTVKCWGTLRELGLNASAPVTMAGWTDVKEVTLGGSFACLRHFDRVSCLGSNDSGVLGDDPAFSSATPYFIANTNGATSCRWLAPDHPRSARKPRTDRAVIEAAGGRDGIEEEGAADVHGGAA
jgi:hypothetical protein